MSDDTKCGLMRLPPEIRTRIWELVLLRQQKHSFDIDCPASSPHDSNLQSLFGGLRYSGRAYFDRGNQANSGCSMHASRARLEALVRDRPVGSTFSCEPTVTRLFDERYHPLDLVDRYRRCTAILRTNKQIFEEGVEVLYKHTSIAAVAALTQYNSLAFIRISAPEDHFNRLPPYAHHHIRRFHIRVPGYNDRQPFLTQCFSLYCKLVAKYLPNAKIFSLHLDIDPNRRKSLDAEPFEKLHMFAEQMRFVVNVHVTHDWHSWSGSEERKVIIQRIEARDVKAKEMREDFIESLSNIFAGHGKKLQILEE